MSDNYMYKILPPQIIQRKTTFVIIKILIQDYCCYISAIDFIEVFLYIDTCTRPGITIWQHMVHVNICDNTVIC